MLYLIGIGLGNEKDITLNGIEAIKKCKFVYLENYTSNLMFDLNHLENLVGKKVVLANREFVENGDEIINNSKKSDVALLVKGDVFSATTHVDLFLRTKHENITCKILHNASILTVIGDAGLSLYKFGKVVSIPFNYANVYSSYETFLENKEAHTLFLLDLKPSENKYMDFKDGLKYLLEKSKEKNDSKITEDSKCIICAVLGTDKAEIKYGKISDLLKLDIKSYPQCIIVPGKMHFVEEEIIDLYKL